MFFYISIALPLSLNERFHSSAFACSSFSKMEKRPPLFSAVLLLVLLLLATGGGDIKEVEARTCESQSHKFKGTCLSHTNCGNVCKTEGFHAGHCRGLRRRCFCTKHC